MQDIFFLNIKEIAAIKIMSNLVGRRTDYRKIFYLRNFLRIVSESLATHGKYAIFTRLNSYRT